MSWNVAQWNLAKTGRDDWGIYQNLMFDFILSQNPDVLCIQEFFESHDSNLYHSTISALKKLGYSYYFFFPSFSSYEGNFEFGLAIFSKYPIIRSEKYLPSSIGHSEGYCFADIRINSFDVRVFNFHTESPGIGKQHGMSMERVANSKQNLSNLRKSYVYRNEQVKLLKAQISNSPYPVIVCGDLGDVPNSYAYFHLKGKMRDVFLEKGYGLGKTYRLFLPTLRIDYIFTSRNLKVLSYNRPQSQYSDHFPIVSEIGF